MRSLTCSRLGQPFLASQFLVHDSLADNIAENHVKPLAVMHGRILLSAIVEAEHLFVQITEQVEWLYGNVSPFQPALQQTPKVFESVRVHLAVYVSIRVIDDLVRV